MTTQVIWWDGTSTTCVEHMGYTLKAEIEAHPRRKTHITNWGEAYILPDAEIKELLTFVDELCETCAYEAGKK